MCYLTFRAYFMYIKKYVYGYVCVRVCVCVYFMVCMWMCVCVCGVLCCGLQTMAYTRDQVINY